MVHGSLRARADSSGFARTSSGEGYPLRVPSGSNHDSQRMRMYAARSDSPGRNGPMVIMNLVRCRRAALGSVNLLCYVGHRS